MYGSPLLDKLSQSKCWQKCKRAVAMEVFKTSLSYFVADKTGLLLFDLMYPNNTKMMDKVDEYRQNTSKLIGILKKTLNESTAKEKQRYITLHNLNLNGYFGDVDFSVSFIGLFFWLYRQLRVTITQH